MILGIGGLSNCFCRRILTDPGQNFQIGGDPREIVRDPRIWGILESGEGLGIWRSGSLGSGEVLGSGDP